MLVVPQQVESPNSVFVLKKVKFWGTLSMFQHLISKSFHQESGISTSDVIVFSTLHYHLHFLLLLSLWHRWLKHRKKRKIIITCKHTTRKHENAKHAQTTLNSPRDWLLASQPHLHNAAPLLHQPGCSRTIMWLLWWLPSWVYLCLLLHCAAIDDTRLARGFFLVMW